MQKAQNKKQNTKVENTKANKEAKTMQKAQETKAQARLEDKIYAEINKAMELDKNIKIQKVTGYTSVKYGNRVLFEFHDKKKAISHLTFAQTQKAYAILKQNKLILRVVPKSYSWKYDTECLLTKDFIKLFPSILKSVIAEAVEERNLAEKQTKKQPAKKSVKA